MPLQPDVETISRFQTHVREAGRLYCRDGLPWRGIDDPYAVYVSEVMLQQTQVKRVLDYWPRFMERFPALEDLAAAPSAEVLASWQGLGYNRRGLAMKRAAEQCAERFGGHMPETVEELESLPGIGPATAAGIVAFAYQKPSIYIETNVRTVLLDWFFPKAQELVSDKELRPLVEATLDVDDPRGWYYALLDWGAHIKQVRPNPSRRSKEYHRQSAFEGSRRQKRAFLLRCVLQRPGITVKEAGCALDESEAGQGRPAVPPDSLNAIIDDLVAEGFFKKDERGRLLP